MLKPLVNLINLSIRESKFPSNWKTSIITPIFKAGSVDEVQNYRPISILPAISKILEKLVAEQLINYLEKHDLLHGLLYLHKLNLFSFSQQAIHWFRSYLKSRDQCVKINNSRSALRNNEMVLPQGYILGPLLFSLYVNDLPNCCKQTKCHLYADDIVIYVSAQTPRLAADILTNEMTGVSHCLFDLELFKKLSQCVFQLEGRKLVVL